MQFRILLGLATTAATAATAAFILFKVKPYKQKKLSEEEEKNKKYKEREENLWIENEKFNLNVSLENKKFNLNVLLENKKFRNSIILAILTVIFTVVGQIIIENCKKHLNKSDFQPTYEIVAKTPYKSQIPNSLHPKYPNVIASKTEGKWVAAPGYKFLRPGTSDLRVIWEPGQPHPIYPNVIASKKEKIWNPAHGYKFVTDDDNSDLRVQPKQGYKNHQMQRPAMLIAQTCNQDIYKPGLWVLATFGDLGWGKAGPKDVPLNFWSFHEYEMPLLLPLRVKP